MLERARRIARVAAAAGEAVVAGLTAALVVLVAGNVAARYVFSIGLPWVDEVVRLLFVWVAFSGAWAALHRGRHLAIVGLVDRFKPRLRSVVLLVGHVLVAGFLIVVLVSGWELAETRLRFGTVTPSLGISVAWSYIPLPVTAALMLVEVAGSLFVTSRAAITGTPLPANDPLREAPD